MTKKVYVDLGSNHGETVEAFLRQNTGFTIYAFEPTPELAQALRFRFADPDLRVTVIESAAWTSDGSLTFYRGRQSDQSSTVLKNKRAYPGWDVDYDSSITVNSTDFDRWLTENTNIEDHIVVKMDIEGAEYRLLAHMISKKSLSRIADLAVEWHADRFPDEVSLERHQAIRDHVRSITNLIDWR